MNTSQKANRATVPLVVGLVVGVVAIAVVVAVLLTGGDDDSADTPSRPAPAPVDPGDLDPRLPAELVGEVRPVEIEGDPLPLQPEAGPDPAIGMTPPTLFAEDSTGFVHTISPDIEGPVMLVFLAHWCPACNQEVPTLVQIEQAGLVPDDLEVYGVLTGIDPSRPGFPASAWLADFEWPFEAVADEPDLDRATWKAADAFGLQNYPLVVVIDDGVVVDRWSGVSSPDALAARIAAAVG